MLDRDHRDSGAGATPATQIRVQIDRASGRRTLWTAITDPTDSRKGLVPGHTRAGGQDGRIAMVLALAVLALAAVVVIYAAGRFNPSSDLNAPGTDHGPVAEIRSSRTSGPEAGRPSTPGTQSRATVSSAAFDRIFSETTDDTLVFDNGFSGIAVIDLDRNTVSHLEIDGQMGGDQPYRIHRVASSLLFGWGKITAFDLESLSSRVIGSATVFVPAAEPDRVWMIDYPGRFLGDEEPVVWQVNMNGDAVTGAVALGFRGFPAHGLPGGLAVETREGVALWDAGSRSVVRQLGQGQAIVADVSSDSIAWCAEPCTHLNISDLAGTSHVQVPADPAELANAEFSPDGTYLAMPTQSGTDVFEVASGTLVMTSADGASSRDPRFVGWGDRSDVVYTSTYSYGRSEMTLSRIDLNEGTSEAVTLPVGGGLAFTVVPRDEAALLLPAHGGLPIAGIPAGH